MEILKREHFNRWYNLGPYYLSVICFEVPFQVNIRKPESAAIDHFLAIYWMYIEKGPLYVTLFTFRFPYIANNLNYINRHYRRCYFAVKVNSNYVEIILCQNRLETDIVTWIGAHIHYDCRSIAVFKFFYFLIGTWLLNITYISLVLISVFFFSLSCSLSMFPFSDSLCNILCDRQLLLNWQLLWIQSVPVFYLILCDGYNMCASMGIFHWRHHAHKGKFLTWFFSFTPKILRIPRHYRLPYSLDQFWLYYSRCLDFVRDMRT